MEDKSAPEPVSNDETEVVDEMIDETDPELTDETAASAEKVAKLRQKLQDCETRKRELGEDLQRAKADFLNARSRLQDEQVNQRAHQIDDFVLALLPVCDSFAMAMQDVAAWESVDETWRAGVEGIKQQVDRTLARYQVEPIGQVGEDFDPERHEAVEMAPVTDDAAHDTVTHIHQTGYQRVTDNGVRVIRPARVAVGKLTS
jgi:molecular chaperone GrpE